SLLAAGAAREAEHHLRDEPRPPGLVRGAEALARLRVEVFEEEQPVAEVGIALEQGRVAIYGAASVRPALEDRHHAIGQVVGPLAQRAGRMPAHRRDAERVAEAVLQAEQGAKEHVPRGEPDGTTPVGVAALHARAGLSGLVADREAAIALPERHRLLLVLL